MTTANRTTLIRAGALTLATAALTLTGCVSGWNEAKFKDTRNLQAPYLGTMGLDVLTANGAIEVRKASSDTIEITALVKARTQERLDNTFITANQIDDDLVVRVDWADGKRLNNEGCTFTIAMPETESITLRSSNGRLTVSSLSGAADLQTSNGRITVTDHIGDVRADTSNGRITLESIDGSVFADTSNGRVRVFEVSGPVEVDTSNGSVIVQLTDSNPGPVNIDTGNGSVVLGVGSAFAGSVNADTSNGSVHCEAPNNGSHKHSKDHWTFNFEGEGRSVIDTSNGSIKIKRHDEVTASAYE